MVFGYARVSTEHQNADRQIEVLREMGIEERNIYVDKESGVDFDRKNYMALRNSILRKGDILVIKELDRLGRNKKMIKDELEYYKSQEIRVKILNIPTTCIECDDNDWVLEMVSNILIEVMSSIAEDERTRTLQRQAEGIKAAKRKGTKFGRPVVNVPDNFEEVLKMVNNGQITSKEAMEILHLKKTTYYAMRKKHI